MIILRMKVRLEGHQELESPIVLFQIWAKKRETAQIEDDSALFDEFVLVKGYIMIIVKRVRCNISELVIAF